MKRYRLCFLGFGNVGRALARLFVSKSAELRDNYGIEWEVTGVATRRMGWRASDGAIDVAKLLLGNDETPGEAGLNEWLARAKPDVVFETTSTSCVRQAVERSQQTIPIATRPARLGPGISQAGVGERSGRV